MKEEEENRERELLKSPRGTVTELIWIEGKCEHVCVCVFTLSVCVCVR